MTDDPGPRQPPVPGINMRGGVDGSRCIGKDEIQGFLISTVFLGINHGWEGPPMWFETMVFRLKDESDRKGYADYGQWRYTTIEEARVGHAEICEKIRTGEIGE